jgi:hypothetical protein
MAHRVDTSVLRPASGGIFLTFCGMFAVGSLAVQLIASASRGNAGPAGVDPVVAHPSTLWKTLGER